MAERRQTSNPQTALSSAPEKGHGFEGERRVIVPGRILQSFQRQRALLSGLAVAGAGYFPKAAGHVRRRPEGMAEALFIYCVKGTGWCETGGRRHTVRAGDLLVVPPRTPHAYGAGDSQPWTIHWLHGAGELAGEYLKELGVTAQAPVVRAGEDLQLVMLFNEALERLEHGFAYLDLLQASHALAHLIAVVARRRHEFNPEAAGSIQKVAQCIIYMSEHLDQPLKISALAALSSLSTAHFTALFKEQTGCAPREYIHLLRIHQACRLLQNSELSIKEIAAKLGYPDPLHFSRRFKMFQGVSPSGYRGRIP